MNPFDPVLLSEIPVIQKIIRDEMWLEGERRGCPVPAHDTTVRENVCRVILRIGRELRESIEAQLECPPPAMDAAVECLSARDEAA